MTEQISRQEHEDRVRRVRSVICPKCRAQKGRPCKGPDGRPESHHHAARYGLLYKRTGGK